MSIPKSKHLRFLAIPAVAIVFVGLLGYLTWEVFLDDLWDGYSRHRAYEKCEKRNNDEDCLNYLDLHWYTK